MVKGLNKFREYFKDYAGNYVIIGGTACDMILGDAGLTARATKDIDIILVVEALTPEFVKQFWEFVKAGRYERAEESLGERKHYRFSKPAEEDFPSQVELFSKMPDILTLDLGVRLTPIPVDDDLSSLSAVLMNEDYYNFTINNTAQYEDLRRAEPVALICLKAFAYVNMIVQMEKGERIDEKNIRKHRSDVFRLMLLLLGDTGHEIPAVIRADLKRFVQVIGNDLPDKKFFRDVGAGNIDPTELYSGFKKNFGLNN
jgi:hypothetical protein